MAKYNLTIPKQWLANEEVIDINAFCKEPQFLDILMDKSNVAQNLEHDHIIESCRWKGTTGDNIYIELNCRRVQNEHYDTSGGTQ